MPRLQWNPERAKGHLTKSLTIASICSWATFTSSVGPSRVILSSPSVNSMCTYHSRIRKEKVEAAQAVPSQSRGCSAETAANPSCFT